MHCYIRVDSHDINSHQSCTSCMKNNYTKTDKISQDKISTCSSSVEESCRFDPVDSDDRILGGGCGGTFPEKHSEI